MAVTISVKGDTKRVERMLKVEAQGVEIRASMAEQSRTMNQGFKDLQDTIIKYMGNGRD